GDGTLPLPSRLPGLREVVAGGARRAGDGEPGGRTAAIGGGQEGRCCAHAAHRRRAAGTGASGPGGLGTSRRWGGGAVPRRGSAAVAEGTSPEYGVAHIDADGSRNPRASGPRYGPAARGRQPRDSTSGARLIP